MKRPFAILALVHGTLVITQAEAVRPIFDTDMGNDVGELMALIAIHTLQPRGAC